MIYNNFSPDIFGQQYVEELMRVKYPGTKVNNVIPFTTGTKSETAEAFSKETNNLYYGFISCMYNIKPCKLYLRGQLISVGSAFDFPVLFSSIQTDWTEENSVGVVFTGFRITLDNQPEEINGGVTPVVVYPSKPKGTRLYCCDIRDYYNPRKAVAYCVLSFEAVESDKVYISSIEADFTKEKNEVEEGFRIDGFLFEDGLVKVFGVDSDNRLSENFDQFNVVGNTYLDVLVTKVEYDKINKKVKVTINSMFPSPILTLEIHTKDNELVKQFVLNEVDIVGEKTYVKDCELVDGSYVAECVYKLYKKDVSACISPFSFDVKSQSELTANLSISANTSGTPTVHIELDKALSQNLMVDITGTYGALKKNSTVNVNSTGGGLQFDYTFYDLGADFYKYSWQIVSVNPQQCKALNSDDLLTIKF